MVRCTFGTSHSVAQLNKSVYFHHLSVCLFECCALCPALHQQRVLAPAKCAPSKAMCPRACLPCPEDYRTGPLDQGVQCQNEVSPCSCSSCRKQDPIQKLCSRLQPLGCGIQAKNMNPCPMFQLTCITVSTILHTHL